MKYNSAIHNRRSIRLKWYDYSTAGAYFVTICAQNRAWLFGEVVDGKMMLNDAGRMIDKIWYEMPQYFPNINMDIFQIMPNHIHGIIITGANSMSTRANNVINGNSVNQSSQIQQGICNPVNIGVVPSLSAVVQSFKRYTTIEYIKMVKRKILPRFNKRVWQRNYYEHIVRNENEFDRIKWYIINNPYQWELKRNNPM